MACTFYEWRERQQVHNFGEKKWMQHQTFEIKSIAEKIAYVCGCARETEREMWHSSAYDMLSKDNYN